MLSLRRQLPNRIIPYPSTTAVVFVSTLACGSFIDAGLKTNSAFQMYLFLQQVADLSSAAEGYRGR